MTYVYVLENQKTQPSISTCFRNGHCDWAWPKSVGKEGAVYTGGHRERLYYRSKLECAQLLDSLFHLGMVGCVQISINTSDT